MEETLKYRVTEKAGSYVAGTRNPGKGRIMNLTEEQARYAVISGELEVVEAAEPAKKAKAQKAD